MEEEMVEGNVNEGEVEYVFTAYEIDLDYEFDAARFFDFSRAETPLEASQAEVWFNSAGSYPPSPFVLSLVPREEISMGNISISPQSKGVKEMNLLESDSDIEVDEDISAMNLRDDSQDKELSSTQLTYNMHKFQNSPQKLPSGLNFMANNNNSNTHTKLSMKPSVPRASTLMKPTASQLAKQSHPTHAFHSRSNTSFLEKTNKSTTSSCAVENQAAKRQKLEGGLLRKVEGAPQLQQTNFVHKAPKRDGLFDGSTLYTKPRITIAREPDLETAHRARRIRPKNIKEAENVTTAVRRFKALPLNRKILEAPSLLPKRSAPRLPNFHEFHLKTTERAMQHSTTVSKSTVPSDHSDKAVHSTNTISDCGNGEPSRTSVANASRPDVSGSSHCFKALPLRKKILTSKGDIGVFRNSKKETTVPMEFNFQTGKRSHPTLPVELFSKLSLASDVHGTPNAQVKLPQSATSMKGSKENRWGCFQQGNEIKQPIKPKTPLPGGKQQFSAKGKDEFNTASGINWSKDIR